MRIKPPNIRITQRLRVLDAGVLSADEGLAAKLRYEDGHNVTAVAERMNMTRRQVTDLLESTLKKLNMANRSKGRQLLRRAARNAGVR